MKTGAPASRSPGFPSLYERNQARSRWFGSGMVAGGIGGALFVAASFAASSVLVGEDAVIAALIGVFVGAGV